MLPSRAIVKARLNVHRPQLGLRIPFESSPSGGVAVGGVSRFIFIIPRCSQSISFLQCLNLYFLISKAHPDLYAARGRSVGKALDTPSTSTTTSGPSSPPTRDRLAPVGRCAAQRRAAARLPRAASDPRRPTHPLTRPKRTPLMATNAAIPKIPCTKTLRRRGSATQWRCGLKKRINLN